MSEMAHGRATRPIPNCPVRAACPEGLPRSGAGRVKQRRYGSSDQRPDRPGFGIDRTADAERHRQARCGRQVRHPRNGSGASQCALTRSDRVRRLFAEGGTRNRGIMACSGCTMIGEARVPADGARDGGPVGDDQRENQQEGQETAHRYTTTSSAAGSKADLMLGSLLSRRYSISTPLAAPMPRFGAAATSRDTFFRLRHSGATEGAQEMDR
jgi:hypothetical protein